MKTNYLLALFLFFLLVIPLRVSAYEINHLGTYSNPIRVEIVPNFWSSLSSLSQQYGFSDYNFCYKRGCGTDLSAPSVQERCLSYMNYCLQSIQIRKAIIVPTCQDGYELSADRTSCVKKNPVQTYSPPVIGCPVNSSYLNGFCVCKDGYVPRDNQCMAEAVKTLTVSPEQTCVNNYGAYSKYAGYLNDKGGYVCDCQPGYEFKAENTPCVKIETPTVKSTNETFESCQKKYGPYGTDYFGSCDCQLGSKLNKEKTACIDVDNIEVPATPESPSTKKIKLNTPAKSVQIKTALVSSTNQDAANSAPPLLAPNPIATQTKAGAAVSSIKNFIFGVGSFFKSIFR